MRSWDFDIKQKIKEDVDRLITIAIEEQRDYDSPIVDDVVDYIDSMHIDALINIKKLGWEILSDYAEVNPDDFEEYDYAKDRCINEILKSMNITRDNPTLRELKNVGYEHDELMGYVQV